MADPPGVVVVGTGFGCVTHVRALRAAGWDVRAIVGRSPERTAARAAAFGVPMGLTSMEQALALSGVDAVTIATPPHLHAPMAREAVDAGKHVLCEKPIARDAAEAREMLAAAQKAGVVHVVGTEFRWDAGQAALARVVQEGAIGDPRLVTVLLHVPSLADRAAEVPAWWGDAGEGGGWLGAHGSQVIDQLRVTLGEFAAVSADLLHVVPRPMTADDGFSVQFRLENGAVGVMQSTCADRGPLLIETRVAGSAGAAWIDGLSSKVWVANADGQRLVSDDGPGSPPPPLPPGVLESAYDHMIAHGLDLAPYTCLATAFRELVAGHPPAAGPAPATFADGVRAMEVLDALRASAASGDWVDVDRHD